MMDLLASAQNKLHDPIVMDWALRRYRHASLHGSDKWCCEMERLWFHDLTLSRWLESEHSDILANMFRTLPARLFVNLKQAVLSRWMEWSGSLGSCAAPVLVESAPEEAVTLLARHIDERAMSTRPTPFFLASAASRPLPLNSFSTKQC
jgi:hypothetical protein